MGTSWGLLIAIALHKALRKASCTNDVRIYIHEMDPEMSAGLESCGDNTST